MARTIVEAMKVKLEEITPLFKLPILKSYRMGIQGLGQQFTLLKILFNPSSLYLECILTGFIHAPKSKSKIMAVQAKYHLPAFLPIVAS